MLDSMDELAYGLGYLRCRNLCNNVRTMQSTLADKIGNIYLGYLALMPAVGTFVLYVFLDSVINPMLFFLLGTAAVGIYLAFTGSYVVVTRSPWRNVLLILDGPLWICLSLALGGSFVTAIVNDVLVEIAGVLLGVMAVTLTSSIPSPAQRRASIIAVGLPLVGVIVVLATYAAGQGLSTWQVIILACAALQSAGVQFALGSQQKVQRDATWVVLVGILSWLAALFVGVGIALGT